MPFLTAQQYTITQVTLVLYLFFTTLTFLAARSVASSRRYSMGRRSTIFVAISAISGALIVNMQLLRETVWDAFPCTAVHWTYAIVLPAWLIAVIASMLRMTWMARAEALAREARAAVLKVEAGYSGRFLDWVRSPSMSDSAVYASERVTYLQTEDSDFSTLSSAAYAGTPSLPSPTNHYRTSQLHHDADMSSMTFASDRMQSMIARMVEPRQLFLHADAPESASRITPKHLMIADWSHRRRGWFRIKFMLRIWRYAILAHLCPAAAMQAVTVRYSVIPLARGQCVGGIELVPFFLFCATYLIVGVALMWRLVCGARDAAKVVMAVKVRMGAWVYAEIGALAGVIIVCLAGYAVGTFLFESVVAPDLALSVAVLLIHTIHVAAPGICTGICLVYDALRPPARVTPPTFDIDLDLSSESMASIPL
ncbi:hypothetical protein THASP1DRAFT_30541 [Thamnocephalis sphaerospora]|uniref:Uncharacterized protein n=1 Tax=Thamnocephalis sphaerospora TaxID=78915 RepID=A0A4P9XQS2_9FUNG|nr:hypothetical protein THASP1DRAFT_30541 [Thamnocephalis sphaerospora]|eukprot:RKP07650.1 hypothetical protein THASP1DRAFT_30541 [Thamnocephalis sphaerospora]